MMPPTPQSGAGHKLTLRGGAADDAPPVSPAQAGAAAARSSGLAGGAAMFMQVLLLMPLDTTINYQYRHGVGFGSTVRTLWSKGGLPRMYRGLAPALLQGPAARFGDTAANAGVLAYLDATPATRDMPVLAKTLCASGAAACWRICLMPLDVTKTVMQVHGAEGVATLAARLKTFGPRVLWSGSLATFGTSLGGHLPW